MPTRFIAPPRAATNTHMGIVISETFPRALPPFYTKEDVNPSIPNELATTTQGSGPMLALVLPGAPGSKATPRARQTRAV
jgi:hypothetical protein